MMDAIRHNEDQIAVDVLRAAADLPISRLQEGGDGTYPLHEASRRHLVLTAQALLARGAEPNLLTRPAGPGGGESPLMRVGGTPEQQCAMIRILLARGADPNLVGNEVGQSALERSAANPGAVELLLQAGARAPTPQGGRALGIACGSVEGWGSFDLLWDAGARPDVDTASRAMIDVLRHLACKVMTESFEGGNYVYRADFAVEPEQRGTAVRIIGLLRQVGAAPNIYCVVGRETPSASTIADRQHLPYVVSDHKLTHGFVRWETKQEGDGTKTTKAWTLTLGSSAGDIRSSKEGKPGEALTAAELADLAELPELAARLR